MIEILMLVVGLTLVAIGVRILMILNHPVGQWYQSIQNDSTVSEYIKQLGQRALVISDFLKGVKTWLTHPNIPDEFRPTAQIPEPWEQYPED